MTAEQIEIILNNLSGKADCKTCPADEIDRGCGCESLCGSLRAGMAKFYNNELQKLISEVKE